FSLASVLGGEGAEMRGPIRTPYSVLRALFSPNLITSSPEVRYEATNDCVHVRSLLPPAALSPKVAELAAPIPALVHESGTRPVLHVEKPPVRVQLKIPVALPGATAPPLDLPAADPAREKERADAIRKLFPDLPPLDADPAPQRAADGRRFSLAEL